MSERQEAMVCPACGPGIGLLAPGAGLSKACWKARLEWEGGALFRWMWGCGLRLWCCGGCGLQTARQGNDGRVRCVTCGWTRESRPEDDEADRHFAAAIARGELREAPPPEPEPPAKEPEQAAFAFVPPPMPNFRRGAQMPAPGKPQGYKPPRQKGTR